MQFTSLHGGLLAVGIGGAVLTSFSCGGAPAKVDGSVATDTILLDAADPGVAYVMVGSPNGNIYSARLNVGNPQPVGAFAAVQVGGVPSYIAAASSGKYIFSVDEANSKLLSFSIDRNTGTLAKINSVTAGAGPAHIAADKTNRWLFSANYGAGSLTKAEIATDGSLSAPVNISVGRNAHYVTTDQQNRFLYVPCLGENSVAQFSFDVSAGQITALVPPQVAAPAGAGPRHLAIRADGAYAYTINERNSTVTTFQRNQSSGELSQLGTLSSLPAGFAGNNTGAAIMATPNGKFLYASNRGHNSVVGFRSDANTGALTLISHTPVGNTPRAIAIDPTGQLLIVGNQDSNSLSIFRIEQSGELKAIGGPIDMPAKVSFVGVFVAR
jgi:6-phosphogluconolactonase